MTSSYRSALPASNDSTKESALFLAEGVHKGLWPSEFHQADGSNIRFSVPRLSQSDSEFRTRLFDQFGKKRIYLQGLLRHSYIQHHPLRADWYELTEKCLNLARSDEGS